MDPQERKSYWAIVRYVHPVLQEPVYVEDAEGKPALWGRQKDAGRWKSHLGLPQRCEVVEVYEGDDGKLHRAYPGWQRRLRQRT